MKLFYIVSVIFLLFIINISKATTYKFEGINSDKDSITIVYTYSSDIESLIGYYYVNSTSEFRDFFGTINHAKDSIIEFINYDYDDSTFKITIKPDRKNSYMGIFEDQRTNKTENIELTKTELSTSIDLSTIITDSFNIVRNINCDIKIIIPRLVSDGNNLAHVNSKIENILTMISNQLYGIESNSITDFVKKYKEESAVEYDPEWGENEEELLISNTITPYSLQNNISILVNSISFMTMSGGEVYVKPINIDFSGNIISLDKIVAQDEIEKIKEFVHQELKIQLKNKGFDHNSYLEDILKDFDIMNDFTITENDILYFHINFGEMAEIFTIEYDLKQ